MLTKVESNENNINNLNNLNNNNLDNSNRIRDSFKNFFKILLNVIYYSEENLLNFFKIIIPFIGALSEINDTLNNKFKKEIYKENYFCNLYIIIMISPSPNSVKKLFQNIIGINKNNKLNFIFTDFKNSEKILMKYNSLGWYSFMLCIYIEYIILTTNDIDKVPKSIFSLLFNIYNSLSNNIKIVRKLCETKKSKIMLMIKLFMGIIHYFYPKKVELPPGFSKINGNDLPNVLNGLLFYKEDFINLLCYMMKIYFYLDNMNLICFENNGKDKNEECIYAKFYTFFLSLKEVFIIKESNNQSLIEEKFKLKNKFKELLCEFPEHKSLILEILNESKEIDFIKKEEKIMNDFVDYNKQYRHLIKELFIFNRPWADQKLFFSSNIIEDKNKLKYKNINYYTNNFQRPIIYPMLDYKRQYPKFSYYKIDNNFYFKEEEENNKKIYENEEEYNFDLNSPEINRLNNKYNEELITKIKKENIPNIQIYNVCLIKRTHHIKGRLFTLMVNGILDRIYFYSFSKKENKEIPSCNNIECNKQRYELRNHENNNHLCYGSFFPCPMKDSNIKICIKLKEIRLIIKRIYFYRKSGIEFFTKTKSYFFNFAENPLYNDYEKGIGEKNCDIFINLLIYFSKDNFYPININNQIIGYSNIFFDIFKKKNEKYDDLVFIENKYINDLIDTWILKDKKNNIEKGLSSFDALIYLNLISNRSYNDLYQYPVFPLLFFYDKNNDNENDKENDKENDNYKLVERDLQTHIGFQINTKMGEKRKKKIVNIFESSKEEIEFGLIDNEKCYYFESNFSNGKYVCNYLLRIFPYSFIAIELQGDGFDDPKNLFNSIEETFYKISSKENDLRELLPEFFYFPEMFLNINKINFNKNKDKLINNVKIPIEILNSKNDDNNNNLLENKSIFYFYCKFIEKMKNSLENKYIDIYKWCNLIFGEKQKNENEQLFKAETYIGFSKEESEDLNKYLKNDDIMNSVEFGLLPNKTIFNEIELQQVQIIPNQNINLSYINEQLIFNKNKKLTINPNNINEDIKEEILSINNNENNYNLNIICYTSISKIEIFINNKLRYEFYENSESIVYLDFNKRLNMFIISSIDGYLYLYILPGKLINVIKHPIKNHYFNYVLLSANPFPSIIAFDKLNNTFYSYSINGIFIHEKDISKLVDLNDDNNINIYPIFDDNNGIYTDFLLIQINNKSNIEMDEIKLDNSNILLNVPFFENIDFDNI